MSFRPSPGARSRQASAGRLIAILSVTSTLLFGAAPQDRQRGSWRDYGGGPDASRFVASTEITKSNVARLQVAWTYPHGDTGFNPIVVGGVVYARGRNNSLIALDASTGREIWIHEGLDGLTNRGINYWESRDGRDRRLIFIINDYLQEIDAVTGKSIMTFGTNGVVDLKVGLGRDPATVGRASSNTPGKVFEDLLLLGSAPGEGYFSPPGDLRAYHVLTGALVWTFHTIPRPGEFGYDTWPKDAYKYAGGANTWGELAVDADRGIAYFPTGSPTYDFYGADRVGANLFGNSLIALDARTGKRLWHFQAVHHDLWDYDNASAPQLTTIRQNGRNIDVVAMAGKTGFLYVFDRVTGRPIWPIEERPVPTKSEVPGEVVYPTQPFPTNPPPFARQRFTADDVAPLLLSTAEQERFKAQVAAARNEGLFTPIGFTDTVHMPGNQGGSNVGGTASHPRDGSVYVVGFNIPSILRLVDPSAAGRGARGGGAAPPGPGLAVYLRDCQACHGADRAGTAEGVSLVAIATSRTSASIRDAIRNGSGRMAGFGQLSDADVDALVLYLTAADAGRGRATGAAAGRGAAGEVDDAVVPTGRGRGAPPPVFRPGPVVASGPAAVRPARGRGASPFGGGYPEGVESPRERFTINTFGTQPAIVAPPYTSLTAYDLNRGVIRWQVGLGDDVRLRDSGVKDTGTALQLKTGLITTATGLVFATSADNKVRAFDASNGKVLWTSELGAPTQGGPAMYELNGRQYLLVTSANVGLRYPGAAGTRQTGSGPTGYIAYALPRR
jgi:quinoprotein glucose dehydrogenase